MRPAFFSFLILISVVAAVPYARGDEHAPKRLAAPQGEGVYLAFEQRLAQNLNKVEEFRFIKEWAEKRNIRVYLFGGAATAFAVYSRWADNFEHGDREFPPEKFDFTLNNIFHFNQDIDILVDSTAEAALELQDTLMQKFPYEKTTGGKTISIWEARPLRYPVMMPGNMGARADVLENRDFQDQNTDSNSAGLIEITDPARGRSRVQDLRSFREGEGRFFRDIVEGRITYYDTGLHDQTSRAKVANPAVISALRFLIKLNEYNLTTDEKSLQDVKAILDSTKYSEVMEERGSRRWIEKNAAKLLENAVDVGAAWNELNTLGVLKKLSIFGERSDPSSIAWAMAQKPLPAMPADKAGSGQTAEQMNLHTIYLKVLDFKTYERLRMGTLTAPNLMLPDGRLKGVLGAKPGVLFASNPNRKPGEIWIAFHIAPTAQIKLDFDDPYAGIVRVFNRRVLQIVPETLILPRVWLKDLLINKADTDFIAYIIRQYNLYSNLTEDEYETLKELLNDEVIRMKYAHLLTPLLLRYEELKAFADPQSFIDRVRGLHEQQELNKPQIAEMVIRHLDAFYSGQPTFEQINELKTLVRHGPQFVAFMNRAMKRFVHSPRDYIQLTAFNEADPSKKYKERMSEFVHQSFSYFKKMHPNKEETAIVMARMEREARRECARLLDSKEN